MITINPVQTKQVSFTEVTPKKCFVYVPSIAECPEPIEYFMHKSNFGSWIMTERTTGLSLNVCENTMKQAIAKVLDIFSQVNLRAVRRAIDASPKVPNDGKAYIVKSI